MYQLFEILYQSNMQRENIGAVETVREPVWSWLQEHCASFAPMTAVAVFSNIFTMNALRFNWWPEVTFFIQQCNQSFCSLCRDQIVKSTSLVVLYITCPNRITAQYENYVCEAVLPNSRPLYCDLSEKHSGDILQYTFTVSLQHFITSPTFLTIELCANRTN